MLFDLVVQYAVTPHSGSDSGGAEMELFFFILFPFLVLRIAVLLYRFVKVPIVRIVAALMLILQRVSMTYLFLRAG